VQRVQSRTLSRAERFALYGVIGWATEIVFTAVTHARDRRLQGHTYLWMLPIYGLTALLFDPVHKQVAQRPVAARAAAYAASFIGVEYASGKLLRKLTGVCPWDYTGQGRFVIDGVTRLDYAPLWAAAGLGVEHIDVLIDRIRIAQP
jgi:uncharacterized membrane protein